MTMRVRRPFGMLLYSLIPPDTDKKVFRHTWDINYFARAPYRGFKSSEDSETSSEFTCNGMIVEEVTHWC